MPIRGAGPSLAGVAGALTFGAGTIHAVAAASHPRGDPMAAAFAATAVLQVVVAVALMARPRRAVFLAAALLNTAAAAAWLVSRWTGLPLVEGADGPSAAGVQDVVTVLMEVAAAAAALVAASRPQPPRLAKLVPAWALAAVPLLIGITAPHPHTGPGGEHHGELAVTLAGDPIFSGADTSRSSEQQLQAARDLIVRTREAVGRLPDEAAVVAAGYRSIGDGTSVGSFEHFVKAPYLTDDGELDPDRVESIVLERTTAGKQVVSAMFILGVGKTLADVPEISGDLTAWHDHQDLCWDATGLRLAGRKVGGRCHPGGTFVATPPMLHVWLQDHRCGPFAGIDGHGTACGKRHAH